MTILVAALSGRALAAAARRAGDRALVADFFGDLDTRALGPWIPLPGDLAHGIDRAGVYRMLRHLPEPIDGIVCGSGFEAAPELLDDMGSFAPLLGNRAEVVAGIKDENRFAALLRSLGLPHPRIAAHPAGECGWLRKKRGGAGGTHVQWAGRDAADGDYFQELAAGRPVSALFVANGSEARVLAFSEQWTAPTEAAPFRYGGCVGPVEAAPRLRVDVAEACSALAAATGLVGLNSLDMLVEDEAFTVLELNPRPGATLEIFDAAPWPPLWRCHLEGVAGRLPLESIPAAETVRAAAIVYAVTPVRVPAGFAWPDGSADIPAQHTVIAGGNPVCTVRAEAASVAAVRAAVEARARRIRGALEGLATPVAETA
jgi:predicted ATP-grasp superfamily ATP-dependent carboligase